MSQISEGSNPLAEPRIRRNSIVASSGIRVNAMGTQEISCLRLGHYVATVITPEAPRFSSSAMASFQHL